MAAIARCFAYLRWRMGTFGMSALWHEDWPMKHGHPDWRLIYQRESNARLTAPERVL